MMTPSEGTDLGVLAQVEGLVDEWRRLQRAIALRLRGDFSPCPPQSAEANTDAAELELEPPPLDDGTPEREFLSRTFSDVLGRKKETVPMEWRLPGAQRRCSARRKWRRRRRRTVRVSGRVDVPMLER